MNKSTLAIIIYAVGIIIGALFLDIWGAETSLLKASIGVVWTVIFLICLFYAEKKVIKKPHLAYLKLTFRDHTNLSFYLQTFLLFQF